MVVLRPLDPLPLAEHVLFGAVCREMHFLFRGHVFGFVEASSCRSGSVTSFCPGTTRYSGDLCYLQQSHLRSAYYCLHLSSSNFQAPKNPLKIKPQDFTSWGGAELVWVLFGVFFLSSGLRSSHWLLRWLWIKTDF